MRETFKFAGQTVKIKNGVGKGLQTDDMSGMDFIIEDWCENVLGCSWGNANGNPAAIEYAIRSAFNGKNNNVPTFSNDVLYGKVGMLGHLFHVNELELPEVTMQYIKAKFLKAGQPAGRSYTYKSQLNLTPGDKVELPGGKHAVVVDEPVDAGWVQTYGEENLKEIVKKVEVDE